ncbi:MAG: translation initiation factor 1, partial [Campylobacterota bacterium]|nr:translation initiation factor 1 [Campylobacterota bacterium]
MSRGKKLDLFIGAEIEDGWAEVQSPRKTAVACEILEPNKHFLVFKKEKRRGKTVTLVGEFCIKAESSEEILKSLKKKLG